MRFSPQPFSTDWSEQDTARRLSTRGNSVDEVNPTQDKDMWLARAIGGHLAWVMGQGAEVLSSIRQDLDTPFICALRELQENPLATPVQIRVGRYFVPSLTRHLEGIASPNEAHVAAIHYLAAGDIPDLGIVEACEKTGARIGYGFRQWQCVDMPSPSRKSRPLL